MSRVKADERIFDPKKKIVGARESGLNTGVGALQGCNRGSRGAMPAGVRDDGIIASPRPPLGPPSR